MLLINNDETSGLSYSRHRGRSDQDTRERLAETSRLLGEEKLREQLSNKAKQEWILDNSVKAT